MEKIEEIIRNFAFALEFGEDDVMRIMHIIEDSLDSDADYETIIDVLDEYNDGTTNFDDLCTEIYLELSKNE